ncbi:unnamed protein product [Hymenolepis diminuta]|uniref:Uncharacterized protein n=1 Tax=Hymenolepis diminuta TaxID=6216 RepID=A0A0R3SXJ3_HYMDI|nr:unnamed protein product [Hymenolepis diminuta]
MKTLNCGREPHKATQRFQRNTCVITTWRWLAEARKTAKKQPIPSTSMPSFSPEEKGQSFESQERLATFEGLIDATRVCILNREYSEVEIELLFPERECTTVFTFQEKLVFMGRPRSKKEPGSRRVDLMDPSTGQVSSLSDMITARYFPFGVATENEIFVCDIEVILDSPDCFSKEVYEAALGRRRVKELLPPSRWSLLPPMIEERTRCAAVNIPDSGILFIGGYDRNGSILRSTELLTRRSGEVASGRGEKWQWLPYTPMNKEHIGFPLAVYFQGRVYVVGYMEFVNEMEMLDVRGSSQWTSLTFSTHSPDQRLKINSMARVGNELFVKGATLRPLRNGHWVKEPRRLRGEEGSEDKKKKIS